MKELGKYETEAHRTVGTLAAERCDFLITVGTAARVIAEAAGEKLPRHSILNFNTADEAKAAVQELVQEGDIVLIKGSQSMRMEKIVKEIMADPLHASDLLVRQEGYWLST
jgi:UDP-N-acetylmuramyl pentapeptide synthase